MYKKIGIKLLISYLILLIVAFSVSAATYSFLSKRYIVNETRKELKQEGQAMAQLLSNISLNSNTLRSKLAGRTVVKATESFVEADLLIINNKKEIIYKSFEDLDKKTAIKLMNARAASIKGIVVDRTPILDKDGTIKGQVILFSKLKNIYGLNRLMRGSELVSMLVAAVVAFLISLVFERSLTKPLSLLVKKMNRYTVTKQLDDTAIKTGDEIQELDQSFIQMTKALKQYDDAQQSFLQNTSHELKTPLMSIQGYAEAIKDGVISGDEMNAGLEVIIEQSQRLKKIVEELIYLTRMESSDEVLGKEATNLKELFYSTCQSVKLMAEEKNIQLDIEIAPEINIYCDRDKLHRAFLNLLSNGIRYAESKITISAVPEKSWIKLLIKDDGAGFKQNEEGRVFDRFYKGERGSTGLGLSIVKAIIEAHDGKIIAYNNLDKGAVFELLLPEK